MNTTIPSYLRIHHGPDPADPSPADLGRTAIDDFWRCYCEATQWRIDHRAENIELLPAVTDDVGQEPKAAVSKSAARRLAESAVELTRQLEANRQALRRQEAELAARAPILAGANEQQRLADHLEQTLSEAALACGCTAAGMYLLDDQTELLKTRAVFGLPLDRLAQPARLLRGSRGDLEAMVQGVVAIDNLAAISIDTWNCPESVSAAICAVIKSDDVPIGTLWLFRDEVTEFGAAQLAAARLAAAALSLQLDAAQAEGRHAPAQPPPTLRQVADWQSDSLPVGTALATDWAVDGMIESPQSWATGWHAWDVLPDGSLMLAIAEAVDPSIKGALNAAIARGAMTSHLGYRHLPSQLLQRVNDTLWQTNTCQQLISLLYVRVTPETGEGEFASAGAMMAMIGSRYGYRPLVHGRGEPLGSDFRIQFVSNSFRMMPGETLLAYGPGMAASGASQQLLGDSIRTAMQQQEPSPLAALRRRLAGMPVVSERGAVTLRRRVKGEG